MMDDWVATLLGIGMVACLLVLFTMAGFAIGESSQKYDTCSLVNGVLVGDVCINRGAVIPLTKEQAQ